ncbi:FKBP-type peptidyl-prolyl cis-trans isomerase [Arthrobacter tumbae]|uniref:FKBP-type peptidyl-prolyl cis-trans isomerase n=1 Tax=Arthrobacter tumbae TaxID=163874 RepID=UPI001958D783|nr:FKBP-type peptidyl-prolyl cis-trans isomerase [Arthrobacter tumbae]MBM7783131.1 peptidylprolyl isomerase [Arthrobacter tumbae]
MRKVLAFLLPALLFLTACGGASTPADFEQESGKSAGASEILESVEVTDAGPDTAPEVEFDAPLDITDTAVRAVTEGDGEVIEAGQNLQFHLVFLNADDGSVLQNSYEAGEPQSLQLTDQLKEVDPELYEVLVGTKVGSQIAYTAPLEIPEGQETATPNQLLVLKVISAETPPAPPKKLSSEEVADLEEAGQLPTVTLDDEGVPSIEFPDNEAPADLVVKVIEEGTGEEITEADTIAANYTGWSWQGEQFDSSFERGEPSEFPLSGVIPGWTQGLSGLKEGAKVLLVIPSVMAYGDEATQGPAGPLAFYVEVVEKVPAE